MRISGPPALRFSGTLEDYCLRGRQHRYETDPVFRAKEDCTTAFYETVKPFAARVKTAEIKAAHKTESQTGEGKNKLHIYSAQVTIDETPYQAKLVTTAPYTGHGGRVTLGGIKSLTLEGTGESPERFHVRNFDFNSDIQVPLIKFHYISPEGADVKHTSSIWGIAPEDMEITKAVTHRVADAIHKAK